MRENKITNNFNAGEWSPFLDGRSDLDKYGSACIKLENFRPLPWGGATLRPGSVFFGTAKYNDRACRLIPFNYSTSLSYVIELGDLYMRFWNADGTQVQVTANTAPALAWVSGTTYIAGDFSTSLITGKTYYCILGTSGTTDPSADGTHWTQQSAYEVPSPYAVGQIFAVHKRQVNAQMRFTHPSVQPQTLVYGGASTSWTMGATAFKYPVLLDQNPNQALTMAVGSIATGASTTLTASAPAWLTATWYANGTSVTQGGVIYQCQANHTSGTFATDLANGKWEVQTIFTAQHVGASFELQHLSPSSSTSIDMDNSTIGVTVYSTPITVQGDWTFTTSQFWWGKVQVQRSIDGAQTWTVIREFTAKSDQNYTTSGTELPPNVGFPPVQYRIAYTQSGAPFDPSIWVGSTPTQYSYAQALLVAQDAYLAGLCVVTGYTSNTQVTVTIVQPPASTAGTYLWSEGAFSTYRGFPRTIGFYEQRLLYAGTAYQPNNIWGSVTGDFDNFRYSSDDDAGVAFQPAVCQQNPAQWVETLLRVHVATAAEEILMSSGNLDEPLTPSNVTVRAQSHYGSDPVQPLLIQNSILFLERNSRRIREMRELSPYVVATDFSAPDLTLLSEHITQPLTPVSGLVLPGGGITCMDFGRLPDPLCYFVRSDGQMPVLTYNREQNIVAWCRYVTNGSYESVASIYGDPADKIFVSVSRPIGPNGANVRTIEGFTIDPASYPSQEFDMLVDCGYQTPFIGLKYSSVSVPWLANQTVTAVVDGAEYAGLVADANGLVTLPSSGYMINVGLPYIGYLTPMKPVMVGPGGGSQGKRVRVAEVVLRMRDSLSIEYAGTENPTAWTLRQFRQPSDPPGAIPPLSSTNADGTSNPNGVIDWPLPQPWPDGNGFSGQINLRQSHPFPTTILGIFTKFDVMD